MTALAPQSAVTPMPWSRIGSELQKLILSGDTVEVTASQAMTLTAFANRPEPRGCTQTDVAQFLSIVTEATKQKAVDDREAEARVQVYWLALSDIAASDLTKAMTECVRRFTFLPTPAEVRKIAVASAQARRHAKSRAAWLVRYTAMQNRPIERGLERSERLVMAQRKAAA